MLMLCLDRDLAYGVGREIWVTIDPGRAFRMQNRIYCAMHLALGLQSSSPVGRDGGMSERDA